MFLFQILSRLVYLAPACMLRGTFLWVPVTLKHTRGGSRGRVQGVRTPPSPRDDLRFSNTTGILQKKTMWFIGVEVEQETSAPPPNKNPGSAPALFTAPSSN